MEQEGFAQTINNCFGAIALPSYMYFLYVQSHIALEVVVKQKIF